MKRRLSTILYNRFWTFSGAKSRKAIAIRCKAVFLPLMFIAGPIMRSFALQKKEEINGFLKWLERYIGASVEDLKNKTKLRTYHDYDFQTLLDVLRQNRRNLKVNTDSRNIQEIVQAEFNASMSKLNPLKSKIAATDRLIDLIVYRLYGLTEEEIEIVEETMRY